MKRTWRDFGRRSLGRGETSLSIVRFHRLEQRRTIGISHRQEILRLGNQRRVNVDSKHEIGLEKSGDGDGHESGVAANVQDALSGEPRPLEMV